MQKYNLIFKCDYCGETFQGRTLECSKDHVDFVKRRVASHSFGDVLHSCGWQEIYGIGRLIGIRFLIK